MASDRPVGWSMRDLEGLATERTRVVAISHVQFTSGYAADLQTLGDFCMKMGIDLVVDAAQSLGAMPLYPDEWGNCRPCILRVEVAPGADRHRPAARLSVAPEETSAGARREGVDYLAEEWSPHETAKRFEYSTSPLALAATLAC